MIIPLLASLVAVEVVVSRVARPDDRLAFCLWLALLVVVSTLTAAGTQRLTRRLAPLSLLFKMSLVFPDEAPSRFGTALRARSLSSRARAIERSRTGASPEQAVAEELVMLMARLDRHDRLTRGHSERVRAYSVMLGEEIGLARGDLDKLNWAALIHDIGKLGVPEAILNKPGRPTDEEWAVLRGHTGAGDVFVRFFPPLRGWLGDWVDVVTQHHERFDGKGYPLGLSGTDISLGARVVAIADAYDVMTAARSYKKPLPAAQARAELVRNAGTQFDPQLVRTFVGISLGRSRWAIGPLAWLAHVPDMVRTPLATATMSGKDVVAAGAVALAAATGVVPAPDAAKPSQAIAVEQPIGDAAAAPGHAGLAENQIPTGGRAAHASPPPTTSAPGAGPAAPSTSVAAPGDSPSATTTTTTSAPAPGGSTPTPTAAATSTPVAAPGGSTPTPTATTTSVPRPGGSAPATTTTSAPAPGGSPSATTTTSVPRPGGSAPATTTTSVQAAMAALDDAVTARVNHTVNIHVLENDDFADSSEDRATFRVVAAPRHGTATIVGRNIRYEPDADYVGTDSFTYEICSLAGVCDRASVQVTVTR